MVRALSQEDHEVIAQTVKTAETRTHAKIALIVSPASDAYQSYILLYGLALGSLFSLLLWGTRLVANFPLLLLMQIATVATVALAPALRHLCLRLIPKRALHHRAQHRAYEEYMIASRHVTRETPFVLFYVSLAERYAHILPNHAAREKVPHDRWEKVVSEFTQAMQRGSLCNACLQAIESIVKQE